MPQRGFKKATKKNMFLFYHIIISGQEHIKYNIFIFFVNHFGAAMQLSFASDNLYIFLFNPNRCF